MNRNDFLQKLKTGVRISTFIGIIFLLATTLLILTIENEPKTIAFYLSSLALGLFLTIFIHFTFELEEYAKRIEKLEKSKEDRGK